MNRAAGRLVLFETESDYCAFESLLASAQQRTDMRIIAYCLMPNHWHLLLWPAADGAITRFLHWLTTVHALRWRADHDAVGRGAVYQSRFKAIPVQSDRHLLVVKRYIERNALRANLVERAEAWSWCSASLTRYERMPRLAQSPIEMPSDWLEIVNAPQTAQELSAVRQSLAHAEPFGDADWRETLRDVAAWRPIGRPKRGRTPFATFATSDRDEKGVRPLFRGG